MFVFLQFYLGIEATVLTSKQYSVNWSFCRQKVQPRKMIVLLWKWIKKTPVGSYIWLR